MTTKTADGKGRITLAHVIPQREVWLLKNPKAKASVLWGLEQAKAGKKAKSPPDLEADSRLAEQLDD